MVDSIIVENVKSHEETFDQLENRSWLLDLKTKGGSAIFPQEDYILTGIPEEKTTRMKKDIVLKRM